MKRLLTTILALLMCVSVCACGQETESSKEEKSKAVQDAIDAIDAIFENTADGTVTIDSLELIENAEKLYNILTEIEKAQVENRLELVEAREAYDILKKEKIFENAKSAYDKLKEAAQICIDGMDDIYGAWYFGIYDADDTYSSYFYLYFSFETPNLSGDELQAAATSKGYTVRNLQNDWNYCLWTAEKAIEDKGIYTNLDSLLTDARNILNELTATYEDYEYYPKLKEYYAYVDSYATFFKEPSGSFNQLSTTINNYENDIRTCDSAVSFLFQ